MKNETHRKPGIIQRHRGKFRREKFFQEKSLRDDSFVRVFRSVRDSN